MRIEWRVSLTKKAFKRALKMPKSEQARLEALVRDLTVQGPVVPHWPNYSKLSGNLYHCHLSRKWVVCWEVVEAELKLIEIYYAGSREDAPY